MASRQKELQRHFAPRTTKATNQTKTATTRQGRRNKRQNKPHRRLPWRRVESVPATKSFPPQPATQKSTKPTTTRWRCGCLRRRFQRWSFLVTMDQAQRRQRHQKLQKPTTATAFRGGGPIQPSAALASLPELMAAAARFRAKAKGSCPAPESNLLHNSFRSLPQRLQA